MEGGQVDLAEVTGAGAWPDQPENVVPITTGIKLFPFQARFLDHAFNGPDRVACLTLPRGNGKSTLMAWLVSQSMAPGGRYFARARGRELVLIAGSLRQCRIVFKSVRKALGEPGYRYADNLHELSAIHLATRTQLIAFGSNHRTLMGLGDESNALAFGDEPAAWGEREGAKIYDAISTSLGKPGSDLRVILAGTRAPARPGNWYVDLVDKGAPGVYVQAHQAKPNKSLSLKRVKKANPLMWAFPESRRQLKTERKAGLLDERARSRFCSYRLNSPVGDLSTSLLTIPQWETVLARPVPDRGGDLILAFDLGGSRAWSSAVGYWESGRVEAVAMVGGIPDLATREKADGVEEGTYRRLVDQGRLIVIAGKRMPVPGDLVNLVADSFGQPAVIKCDKFKLAELQDACDAKGYDLEPRWMRMAQSTEDIQSMRSLALDGNMAIEESSRALLTVSMAASMVQGDDQGSIRQVKKGDKSSGRDDVAVALVLAAGEVQRRKQKPQKNIPPWIVPRPRRGQVADRPAGETSPGRIVDQ